MIITVVYMVEFFSFQLLQSLIYSFGFLLRLELYPYIFIFYELKLISYSHLNKQYVIFSMKQ